MAAIITDWEKRHIESIQLLLQKATEIVKTFEEKEKVVSSGESDLDYSRDWYMFRHFVLDLYSVLDYVWYLLYCHFSNDGNADFTSSGRTLGFPSKPSGIKWSAQPSVQDQRPKFVKDWLQRICKDMFGEGSHLYRIVNDYVLEVQPKMSVDASGDGANTPAPPHPGSDEESFLLLHFYRNCAAHRDLVRFAPSESYAEINQKTREIKLVTKREEKDGYYYHKMQRGYWIQLPEISARSEPRLLLDVLHQMTSFVHKTSIVLLSAALLVTPAHESLRQLATNHPTDVRIVPSPKKVKNPPLKNKRMVLHEYIQKLKLDDLKVTLTAQVNAHPDKREFFVASLELIVSTKDDQKIVKFNSGEFTEIGKDRPLLKAAEKILEDLIRLGLVISESDE